MVLAYWQVAKVASPCKQPLSDNVYEPIRLHYHFSWLAVMAPALSTTSTSG